ncbi:MAG: DUF2141 domain-containing protein [Janthinobacterium lividum]
MARACLYGAVAVVASSLASTAAPAATLEVTIANVRNNKGHVRVAACTSATFLKERCAYNAQVPSVTGETVVRLEVPPGTWAVQAYQDENDSGKVDRNLLGIPTVGLGFSNDAPFRFGPPSYGDAAFQLGAGGGRIRLTLRYF